MGGGSSRPEEEEGEEGEEGEEEEEEEEEEISARQSLICVTRRWSRVLSSLITPPEHDAEDVPPTAAILGPSRMTERCDPPPLALASLPPLDAALACLGMPRLFLLTRSTKNDRTDPPP